MKLIIAIVILMLTCTGQAQDEVELYLKWTHQFQFAGYYAAIEQGYFEEEGLKVKLIERKDRSSTPEKVLLGPGKYAVSDSSVVLDYLKGKPYIIVSSIFQHSPIALAIRADTGILGPIELTGKRVMYQKGVDDAALKVMFRNSGLNEDDIYAVPHTMDIQALVKGEVDAMSVYSTNQPYQFEKIGFKYRLLQPMNYGVDLYGDTLITSKAEASSHPARALAMQRASIRGWYYALSHIDEMVELIKTKYDLNADVEKLRFEGIATQKMIRPDLIPIGETQISRLRSIVGHYNFEGEAQNDINSILLEVFLRNKSGTPLWLKKVILFVGLLAIVGLTIIVFFNRSLKRKIAERTSDLQKILQERDLFFSSMTHELRTPLNGIAGSIFLIEEAIHQPPKSEYVKAISQCSQLLLKIVDDILDFTKLENKSLELDEEPQNLSQLVNDAVIISRQRAEEKGLEFYLDSNIDTSLWVMLDRAKLVQVLNNLIGNAIKFTSIGSVTLRCRALKTGADGQQQVEFSIVDTGTGMNPSELGELFRPFSQANKKITNTYGGTGLGLVISQKLVQLLGGNIEALIPEEAGMEFRFSISCTECDPVVTKPVISTKVRDLSHLNVLIVDDNLINTMLLEKYLKKFNVSVGTALNGKEALEIINKENFDLIFMDREMPIMNGEEAIHAIRSNEDIRIANSFIVGQSANWRQSDFDSGRIVGVNRIIPKPTKFSDIADTLESYENWELMKTKSA